MRALGPLLLAATLFAQDSAKSAVPIRVARKVALVIGNSAYTNIAPVPPAIADADDMTASLKSLGFDLVVTRKNLARDRLIEEVTLFAQSSVRKGDLALIYYSGHGGQVRDENYLLPVDFAPPSIEALVDTRAYRMSSLRAELEASGADVRVLIFDACRNALVVPAKSSSGLRELKGNAEGTMIAFASAHNQIARFDNKARNSFYTAALLESLRQPGDLKGLLETVQRKVFERTGRQQIPYLYGFLSGPVYLGGEPRRGLVSSPAALTADAATEAWNGIKQFADAAVFVKFSQMFPNHDLAKAALLRAETLRQPASPTGRDGAIWIKPGSFFMGCSSEDSACESDEVKPARSVAITKGFWMKTTEVSQTEFEGVVGSNPSQFRGPNRPVDSVDWNQARAYCEREGGRLPTAAEWEYAARAGTTGPRYGDTIRIAWGNHNSNRQTHEVRRLAPNAWGLFDMIGNVWEWTADNYDSTSKETRGGSWLNDAANLRASDRNWWVPSVRYDNVGFRCVWD